MTTGTAPEETEKAAPAPEESSNAKKQRMWKMRSLIIECGLLPPRDRQLSKFVWSADPTDDIFKAHIDPLCEQFKDIRLIAQEMSDLLGSKIMVWDQAQLESEIQKALGALKEIQKKIPVTTVATPSGDFTRPSVEDTFRPRAFENLPEAKVIQPVATKNLKPQTLEDLVASFPIGDGYHRIHVNRIHPKVYRNLRIEGVQAPIEQPEYRWEDFRSDYGGGSYWLTVYGPSEPVTEEMTSVKEVPLHERIRVNVPMVDCPPNLDACSEDGLEEEENMMNGRFRGVARGLATPADAKIHEVELEHAERREEREEERRREQEEREERKRRIEESEKVSLAKLLADQQKEAMAREERLRREEREERRALDEQRREEERARREEESRRRGEADPLNVVRTLAPLLAPKDDSQGLMREMERMREHHRMELEALRQQHAESARRYEDHRREERERLDRERRDFEDRARIREQEVTERARRDVEDARNETTRRLAEMQLHFESRLNDERRQHDRDIAQIQNTHGLSLESNRNTITVQLEMKDSELRRVNEELKRVRIELEAEKSKSIADRVKEFSDTAEALGYQRDGGGAEAPRDWKTMLGEAATGLVGYVPQLATSFAQVYAARQAPAQAPVQVIQQTPNFMPPVRAMGPAPMPMQAPMAVTPPGTIFASEDGDFAGPPPAPPESRTKARRRRAAAEQAQAQQAAQSQVVPSAAEHQMEMPMEGMQAIEQPPQAEQPQVEQVPDEAILQVVPMFRAAFSQGETPEKFVEELQKMVPDPNMLGGLVVSVTPDRVLSLIPEDDALTMRDGQAFLRKVHALLMKAVGL